MNPPREWSFRGTDAAFRQRYFRVPGSSGGVPVYPVRDELKRHVRFQHHNLATGELPNPRLGLEQLDLILCRNVMLYLSPSVIRELAGRFRLALSQGGWLMTGVWDPPLPLDRGLLLESPITMAYRAASTRHPLLPEPFAASVDFTGAPPWSPAEPWVPPEPPAPPPEVIDVPWLEERAAAASEVSPEEPKDTTSLEAAASAHASAVEEGLARVRGLFHEDRRAAVEVATSLVRDHAMVAEVQLIHAELLLALRRAAEAREAARRALYLCPGHPVAYYLLALGSIEMGKEALRSAQRAFAAVYQWGGSTPTPFLDNSGVPVAELALRVLRRVQAQRTEVLE